jgi:Ca2+-binding EF-hand superfamily protein
VAKASKGEGSGAGSLGVGSSAEELERLMRVADIDEDGAISYDELLLTCVQRKINAKEERIWEAFCKLDLDGNGRLTKDGQW